jgi:5'-3' exonuclease
MQLIDGGMIAFAAYHALKKKVSYPLTFQVPRMIRAMLEQAEDTYAVFWNGAHLWKRELWPPYRDRPEIWAEAGRDDFDAMLVVLSALGAVQYRVDDREADELLASASHALEGTEPIVIRSDDKDFMQLLTPTTGMHGRVRGNVRHSDVEGILGVKPEYVVDFLALAGDPVDGIPRIMSPGDARDFIRSHGHVRDLLGHSDAGAGGRARLEPHADQLAVNLDLVDLSREAVGHLPGPMTDVITDLDVARTVGERLKIDYLRKDDLEQAFRSLSDWGARSRERLGR